MQLQRSADIQHLPAELQDDAPQIVDRDPLLAQTISVPAVAVPAEKKMNGHRLLLHWQFRRSW